MWQGDVFAGKVALVTGASRGIGRDIALSLAAQGCDLAFCYRRESEQVQTLQAAIEDLGRQVLAIQADIAQEKAIIDLFEQIKARFGRLDILVNNAGHSGDGLLATMSLEHMQALIAGNLLGTMLCCREALRLMLPQRSGSIINLSSVSASQPNRGQTAYAATKGAVEGFTRALAVEVAGKGIRVNAVAPGVIATEMTDNLLGQQRDRIMQRLLAKKPGSPRDISLAVLYLANPENHYVTGEVLPVNGGLTLT